MSYNGSGTFLINTAGQPVVTGTVISSTVFNTLTADLGTGLSTAITKDGQTTTTSRIPFIAGISSTLTTDSTSVGTGSIITSGGVGIAKALFVGTTANIAGAVTLGGAVAITSSSANALAVGLNGATNPAFNVDASTASSATGLNVKSAAAAGGVALSVTSSGSNEALTLNAKGTGTIGIGSVSTGAVTITPATTITGAATLSSTLDVTGIASFAAGSAAAPAITRTGDLDTGVYFPAANTLGFSTSGSERARLDSGGILGIGVTPGAWGGVSANAAIQIKGASFFGRTDNSDAFVGTNFYRDSSNVYTYINTAAAAFLQLSGNAFNFSQAASGTAGNPITFTTKMTLDASGNLGIGTSSPTATLHVAGAGLFSAGNVSITPSTATNAAVYIATNTGGTFFAGLDNSTGGTFGLGNYTSVLYNGANTPMVFLTNATERARFNSTGALVFAGGTTTANGIGITFPATQSASTNANTLDDYEEGTWTAAFVTVSGSITISSSFNTGRYTKVGRLVSINLHARFSSVSSPSSTLSITGLPFTSDADSQCRNSGTIAAIAITTLATPMTAYISNSQSTIIITGFVAASGGYAAAGTYIDASSELYITMTYYV